MDLKKTLRRLFQEDELNLILVGYDLIGDIAILSLSPGNDHLETQIAALILSEYSSLRLVAKRKSNCRGEFRTASLEKIGGEGGFSTIHKEYGLRFQVNPQVVYFSPRSGTERIRITRQVESGENVLVMFSGVGAYPLMIARHSEAERITGVEKNPQAHNLAVDNLKINTKVNNVELICGDVKDEVPKLNSRFDRILMPLPIDGDNFLDLALDNLSPGGRLHFYDFQKKDEFSQAVAKVNDTCHRLGRELISSSVHRCGHIASRTHRVCVDAMIG